MGHTSEVSYAIFGMILFGVSFSTSTVGVLESIENPIVALLTLDAQQQGLIPSSHTFGLWQSLMNPTELKTSNWLLAYEALINGWLPSATGSDYIKTDDGFMYLQSKDVHFYDHSLISSYSPSTKYWALKDITPEQMKYVLEPSNNTLQPTSYLGG
ncbi:MAG: hypothetical protein K9L79_02685 [Methylobacter tundripaludum]|nr:hypothetical protein [Methylobacter tundripaludum]